MPATRLDLLRTHARAALAGAVVIALMLFWAVDDGGFAAQTWYWGALVALATLAVLFVTQRHHRASMPRALAVAVGFLALYVAWSYLSIAWAEYPGAALQGSNRTLLYLIVFWVVASVSWTEVLAATALLAFSCGVGVIGVVLMLRFAIGTHVAGLFYQGRLVAPTGYFNSTAALFTMAALVAVALAARRTLPGLLRGLLLAFACVDLEIALTVQSRGWLFTLPVVGLLGIIVAGGRLRVTAHAILPILGALAATRPLLRVYQISDHRLAHEATHAGKVGLLTVAAVFFVTTLIAWIEQARGRPPLGAATAHVLGTAAAVVALAGVGIGLYVVSGHRPGRFISREAHAFVANQERDTAGSHFADVGSGRVDIWRVAWKAFVAHPVGGLGQDNFGDYYLIHRHGSAEPEWPHSLEMRLLACTGAVGLLLFAGFIAAALTAAIRARSRGTSAHRMLVAAALLPLVDWLVHGSIDWFWEVPALGAPALGFLAMAGRIVVGPAVETAAVAEPSSRRRVLRPVGYAGAAVALLAATFVLGVPLIAERELALGERASFTNVSASLADFHRSHELNPLASDPGDQAGTVALVNGQPASAIRWFTQALGRRPDDWYAWLGRGLAESRIGSVASARHDFRAAARINAHQPVVGHALRLVATRHPLTIAQALAQIVYLA